MRFIFLLAISSLLFVNTKILASDLDIHGSHPHHLSVFLGQTHFEGSDTEHTVGIDYEYRVNQLLGLGVVVEHAFGELDATTYLMVADIHITNSFIMQLGPGFERASGHELAVARVGLLYEYTWGHFTFAPQVHYDYHETGKHNGIVFGIALGAPF